MEWLLANPQINSTFGSLGSYVDDVYLVNDDCLRPLEEIICKLAVEDTALRTFRRAIGFSQNVKNDIVPLLVNAKDAKIIDTTIRLLVNLTVPVECLLPVASISRSDVGQHTIFELNMLLITCKEAFVEWKNTKAVIDHMKRILEKDSKLSIQNCDSINNCLLLLRNILHVPEGNTAGGPGPHPYQNTSHNTSFQNQIIWNLFTQSVDKLLIHLMSCPQRSYWAVTMAQLVALMYKDQHISTLQKLLNIWFESTMSESSDDNESNTSPSQQCSGESSPMLTSDPTSDSSDNGNNYRENCLFHNDTDRDSFTGSGKMSTSISSSPEETDQVTRKGIEFPTQIILARTIKSHQMYHQSIKAGHELSSLVKHPCTNSISAITAKSATIVVAESPPSSPVSPSSNSDAKSPPDHSTKNQSQLSLSENSDCGYGTQVEKESISTSSNEDDGPNPKPIHQKPRPNQKQRFNAANKHWLPVDMQDKKDLRRKKLVKRSKSNMYVYITLMSLFA